MNKGLKIALVILIILSIWFGSSYLVFKGVVAIINWEPREQVAEEHKEDPETVYLEEIDTSFIEKGIDVLKKYKLPIEIDSWHIDNENRTLQEVDNLAHASDIHLFVNLVHTNYANGMFELNRDSGIQKYEKDKDVFYTILAAIQSVNGNRYKKSIEIEFYTTGNDPFGDELFQNLIKELISEEFDFATLEKEFIEFLDGKTHSADMFYNESIIPGAEVYQTIYFDKVHMDYEDDETIVGFHLDTEKPIYRFSYTIVFVS